MPKPKPKSTPTENPSWRNHRRESPQSSYEPLEGQVFVADTCGRCFGYGELRTLNGGTCICPICKGSGQSQRIQTLGSESYHPSGQGRYADGRSTRRR